MPANIVNLDELVPGLEGKTFVYRGEQFHVPGDLSSETVFEFLKLYDDLLSFQIEATEAVAANDEKKALAVRDKLHDVIAKIQDRLLTVFKLGNPALESLPFGQQTTIVVLGEVLEMMGIAGRVDGDENPPPPALPKKAARRSTARKTTSTRSRKAS